MLSKPQVPALTAPMEQLTAARRPHNQRLLIVLNVGLIPCTRARRSPRRCTRRLKHAAHQEHEAHRAHQYGKDDDLNEAPRAHNSHA